MKILLSLILVLLYKNCEVSSYEILDLISEKFIEFKDTIFSVISAIKNPFSLIMAEFDFNEIQEPLSENLDSVYSKSFSDFVAEEAAKIKMELPEYYSFRSEPTALMSTPQLATLHGKSIESHLVVTEDGYILTLHRLVNPFLNERNTTTKDFTILMHHGLLGSSADWILLGPKKSLPYMLSDAGCDVWLTNARGNYYSREHNLFKINSSQYWNFSWEEMGTRDLPAVVTYINKFRNSTRPLNFIGHSMGATAFLVMLAVNPVFNDYFRKAILLAPLVYMTNIIGPMRSISTVAKTPPRELLKLLGHGEFSPNREVPLWIISKYCKGPEIYCINPLLFLSGSIPEANAWSKDHTARVLYHVPAGGSTKTILHYAALAKTSQFHDYGTEDAERYEYPLHNVRIPVALFSSDDDWLATKADVLRLYFKISNPIDHFVIQGAKLSHADFVWHPNADKLVFSKVVECLAIDNVEN